MRTRLIMVAAVVATSLVVVAGANASVAGAAGGGRPTYTVGVLADLTGPGSSTNHSLPQGVYAGIKLARAEGYDIRAVVADTGTSPSQVLTAAQKLVDVDHVFAVIAASGVLFGATPFLTAHGIPVLGWSEDGPEWLTSKNMFSPGGPTDTVKVATTLGLFMQREGVTSAGFVGYGYVLSAEAAESQAASAREEGIKVGYLDTTFPLGSTNVQPLALAIKNDGVNGISGVVEPNAALALIVSLHEEDVALKAAVLFTGYGGDLEQGGTAALLAAQGVYFAVAFEPFELHTAATERFARYLKAIGIPGDPTFAEYMGYTSVDLLVHGLERAGAHPTQAGVIKALNGLKDYNAAGLLGTHTFNVGARTPVTAGVDNCLWFTKLVGRTFQLIPGAEPLCGAPVPGVTVASS